jgi:glycosyltransferase involved in cell wall biosynthesis
MVRLDSEKFESYFCYLTGCSDGINEMDKLARAVFYDYCKPHGPLFNKIKSAYAMSKIIDEHGIDLVNCQREKTMPVGVLASLLSKKKPKVVVTVHGLVGGSDYGLKKKIKNYIYYGFLERVICVSDSVKKDVIRTNIGNISDKVVSVQNGLVCDRFLSEISKEKAKLKILPPSKLNFFWFGTIGRLSEVKNHENMIIAFKNVLERNHNCLLLIVGDGPLKDKLSAQVATLELTENVLFLGKRGDVADILKALDVFVFPSYREGFGLALLEAMASGVPIVASDIPVFKEIGGGYNIGRLADPHDPAALAAAMSEMMTLSKDELQNMGEKAKTRAVNDFSAAKMVRNYETLYEQIFNGSRPNQK